MLDDNGRAPPFFSSPSSTETAEEDEPTRFFVCSGAAPLMLFTLLAAHADQAPITNQFYDSGADSSPGSRIVPVHVSALCCFLDQSWWKLGVLLPEIDEPALANSVLM